MIALYIFIGFLLLVAGILFLPLTVHLKFQDDFYLKIKFAGIRVFKIEPKEEVEKQEKPKDTVTDKKAENTVVKEGKKLFQTLKEKYGFGGAVKSLFGFFASVLSHIKKLLWHIKICNIKLKLTVAGSDAAETAIEYGAVCAAVYPVMAFLESYAKMGLKNIDVRSDFTGGKNEFGFSAIIKMQVFFLLVAAFRVYKEYKNYLSGVYEASAPDLKENNNERK